MEGNWEGKFFSKVCIMRNFKKKPKKVAKLKNTRKIKLQNTRKKLQGQQPQARADLEVFPRQNENFS